jgi:putative transposase
LAFDDRILTWNRGQQVVSIWTVKGRLKIPFEAGPRQTELLKSRQGESDLILHKGVFYLAATCHVDQPESVDVEGFLGVDPGVGEIAVTSAGKKYSGAHRQGRQASPSPPAQQTAKEADSAAPGENCKELSGREARFAAHTSHVISKQIALRMPDARSRPLCWKS